MLKAVNMDLPCDSAGWCHALLSQWVSHWEIQWFNNHLSPEYSCLLHLCWIQCECDLNGLYTEMTLALVTFVAGLQCLSPVHIIPAESHYISVSVKLSLSDCIFGNMYNSTYPTMGEYCSYVPFASLWFPLQSQLWKEVTHSFFGNISRRDVSHGSAFCVPILPNSCSLQ